MKALWKKLFTRIDRSVYIITAKSGTCYTVTRHQWVHPTKRWGWKAKAPGAPGAPVIYDDTLFGIANDLGYAWDELEAP